MKHLRANRRLRFDRRVYVAGALLLAAGVPMFASCAETEGTAIPVEDSGGPLPEAGAGGDASADGDCDAGDGGCSEPVLSCDEAPWCPVETGVSKLYQLITVWGSDKDDVWAAGSGGTIIHYDGAAWTPTPTPVRNTFYGIWGSGPSDVWAVAMTDTIFHSTGFKEGADVWTRVPGPVELQRLAKPTYSVWGTPGGKLRIGSRPRSIFNGGLRWIGQYELDLAADPDAGVAWNPVYDEGSVRGIWGSSADDVWIVVDNSERSGWEKGISRHGVLDPKSGELVWTEVDTQCLSVLEAIWGSSADDIWAVGDQGAIRRMKKGATRWEIVASPTTEALHAIWGSSANDVWAVGDSGTILHFDGESWKPSLAAFAPGRKPHLYGVWGSSADDVWIVGEVALHFTGPKGEKQ